MGLGLADIKELKIPYDDVNLTNERETARANKDWKLSDEFRLKNKSLGYEVEESSEGSKIKKI